MELCSLRLLLIFFYNVLPSCEYSSSHFLYFCDAELGQVIENTELETGREGDRVCKDRAKRADSQEKNRRENALLRIMHSMGVMQQIEERSVASEGEKRVNKRGRERKRREQIS